MPTGVILAGGRSTRFGDRDKAVAELAGTPMIRRVGDRIAPASDDLVINCREDQLSAIEAAFESAPMEPTFAIDETPDQGPVAGIRSGLRAATGEYAFVVACDMPFVDPNLIRFLLECVTATNRDSEGGDSYDAAVPRLADQWFQTTQALYHTAAMADACDRALQAGNTRVLDPLMELDFLTVDEPALRDHVAMESFENINTLEAFEAAADRVGPEL